MSTVRDIESAIARWPQVEVEAVAAWLDEYRQTLRASADVFSLYDDEEVDAMKRAIEEAFERVERRSQG